MRRARRGGRAGFGPERERILKPRAEAFAEPWVIGCAVRRSPERARPSPEALARQSAKDPVQICLAPLGLAAIFWGLLTQACYASTWALGFRSVGAGETRLESGVCGGDFGFAILDFGLKSPIQNWQSKMPGLGEQFKILTCWGVLENFASWRRKFVGWDKSASGAGPPS